MVSDWDAASYDRVSDPQVRWAHNVIARIEGYECARDPGLRRAFARKCLAAACGVEHAE